MPHSWTDILDSQNCTFHEFIQINQTLINRTLYIPGCIEDVLYALYHVYKVWAPLEEWEITIFSIAYVLLVILGVFGNGLVVYAVLRKGDMRTNRNVFIANLAVSNLVLALILYPFVWIPQAEYQFTFGSFLCKFCNAFPGSNLYCSTLTISMMSIDRYYLVKQTHIVDSASRKVTAILLASGVWVLSLLLCLPIYMSYDVNVLPPEWGNLPVGDGKTRTFGIPVCRFQASVIVAFVIIFINLIFLYIIPLAVLGIFNLKLSNFIQNQARSSLLQSRSSLLQSRVRYSCGSKEAVLSSLFQRRTSGMKTNSAVSASEQRRNRTTHLMIAMAGSYALLWLPFTIISMLTDLGVMEHSPRLDYTAKLISLLSICVNPFLYGWLNTNFNREFHDIFSQLPCYKWYMKRHPELRNNENAAELKMHARLNQYGSVTSHACHSLPLRQGTEDKGVDSPCEEPGSKLTTFTPIRDLNGINEGAGGLIISNYEATNNKMCEVILHKEQTDTDKM